MSVNSLSAQCMLQQFFRLSVRAVKSNTFHHVLTGNWRPAKSTTQEIHTSKMHHIPTRCQAVTTSDLHRWATIRKPAHLPCRRRRPHHRLDQVLTTLRSSTMTSTNKTLLCKLKQYDELINLSVNILRLQMLVASRCMTSCAAIELNILFAVIE